MSAKLDHFQVWVTGMNFILKTPTRLKMKRYEDKVFTNLTTEEAELKQTFEQVPRFAAGGDASDFYYLSSQVEAEKIAALTNKSLEDEEVSNFKMKSFVRSAAQQVAESTPHIASKPIRDPPVATTKIFIKPKKRKADNIEGELSQSNPKLSSSSSSSSAKQKLPEGNFTSDTAIITQVERTSTATAVAEKKESQLRAPSSLPIDYDDSSGDEE